MRLEISVLEGQVLLGSTWVKVRRSYAKRLSKMKNLPEGMHNISVGLHIGISIFSNIINVVKYAYQISCFTIVKSIFIEN